MADPNPLPNTVPTGLGGHSGAEITSNLPNSLEITQTANQAIMNWNNFDIGSSSSVQFFQPGATSAVLNRVTGSGATGIMGSLKANGRVFIINPAGVVFGKGAKINVTQLTASALELEDGDFLNGAPYQFINGATAGDVIFNAHFSDVTAERIFLIGKNVLNKGGLVANDFVVMAAGDSVLISEPGSSVAVVVDMGGLDPAGFTVKNQDYIDGVTTKLEADHVILAAGDIWSQAISNVETAEIYAAGEIQAGDLAGITASATASSDAVAGVSIASASNVTIDDDISVTATGNGVDNASATIDITAGGDLTIKSNPGPGEPTILSATASDGLNNTADITLTADGAFVIDAPHEVTVKAEAAAGQAIALLNQANVNITGSSVLITATDLGNNSDEPATVGAYAHNAAVNRAGVDIQSAGNVGIIGAGSNGDSAIVEAVAQFGSENYANITINAGGDVDIIAQEGDYTRDGTTPTVALVRAKATNAELLNDASVDITAGGDVTVKSEGGDLDTWTVDEGHWNWEIVVPGHWEGFGFGRHWVHDQWGNVWHHNYVEHSSFIPYVASVEAIAENAGSSNTALVDITAGGDIVVLSKDGGEARVESYAGNSSSSHNTANINLTAEDGYVLVHAIGGVESTCDGFTASEASVEATAENAGGGAELAKVVTDEIEDVSTNIAKITIIANDIPEPVEVPTDVKLLTESDSDKDGDVMVIGVNGGEAEISAKARNGDENAAGVEIRADGDVKVIAECKGQPSEAEIEALAEDGYSNIADVLICINGGVEVRGEKGGEAEIEALALDGFSNTATVGIGAHGVEGVQVIAEWGGEAGISSKAKDGYTNTASTIVCTNGGVDVKATYGGDAEILAQAKNGITNDAYVGVCAVGNVVVQTGKMPVDLGCNAVIRAEAEAESQPSAVVAQIQQVPIDGLAEPTTANARTVVVSHEGNVEVRAYNRGHSGIEAEAQGAHLNTASVGVAAGADLSPADVALPVVPEVVLFLSEFGPLPLSGNVIVDASRGSKAQILAYAHDASPIYESPVVLPGVAAPVELTRIPGENTADVVICAPGEVRVTADRGSDAKIKSWAGGWREEGSINNATMQVYASEVTVDVPDRSGNGITAWAVGSDPVKVPDNLPLDGRLTYCLTEDGVVAKTDGVTLIVDTWANRTDCPTCPPCPCEEAVTAPVVAAPIPVYQIPRIAGCPQLTKAAAAELGVPEETLQVGLGNALAINPNIQACQACASLLNSASILKDPGGSRMAAMVQVFNATAPADAPYTPEMATSIAMAFEGAAEGSQYASATEFIDAFVQYAAALDSMGAPVGEGDSTAFVMGKYGQGLSENMSSFVAGRIAEGQTF